MTRENARAKPMITAAAKGCAKQYYRVTLGTCHNQEEYVCG